MNNEPTSCEYDVSDAEVSQLRAGLDAFNTRQTGRDDFQALKVVLRDAGGQMVAGLIGQTGWDWLYIEVVWVHEDRRGQGL